MHDAISIITYLTLTIVHRDTQLGKIIEVSTKVGVE